MRLPLLCFCAIVWIGVTAAASTWKDDHEARRLFQEFKDTYGKNYNGYDNEKRFAIFKDNLRRAEEYQREELGTAEYGVTQFSDLTNEEFRSRFASTRFDSKRKPSPMAGMSREYELPESVDWRAKGAVGPVEDQGACGSCWAFSVTGNVEGQWFKKTGKLLTLSKQELVDCDQLDSGCNGGYPPDTYKEIIRLGGMEEQRYYQYHARDETCHLDKSKIAVYINSSVYLSESEDEQAKYLAENGPLSIALNANPLQYYRSGIMKPRRCSPEGINHGVLSVGYGVENGMKYWIVKNSWGKFFGEQGYFRIFRGEGTCGVNLMTTSSVIY